MTEEAGRRFVITGVSRLSVRVARALTEAGAEVVLVAGRDADDDLTSTVARVATIRTEDTDRATSLRAAGLEEADGLLALDDDDLDNLRTVGCAAAVAPAVPVVLRSFDAALADRVELGSNVRRAFSLSALAAPAFVAAAIGDDALTTLRLGDDEVPLVQLTVGERGPLVGQPPSRVTTSTGVTVVARRAADDSWRVADDDRAIVAGDELLVGGHLKAVLGPTHGPSRLLHAEGGVPSGPPLLHLPDPLRREQQRRPGGHADEAVRSTERRTDPESSAGEATLLRRRRPFRPTGSERRRKPEGCAATAAGSTPSSHSRRVHLPP